MNTRDPRDPRDNTRDTRDTRDNVYRETRTTYSTTPEPRTDRSWLRWAIPVAIAALLLPLLFRGHREPQQRSTALVEQSRQYGQSATGQSVYLEGGSSLTDADRQKLAQMASTARANGTGISVSGSRDSTEAVRQALLSQGVPESSIDVRAGDTSDRTVITLAQK